METRKYAKKLLKGIIESLFTIILYLYIIPELFGNLYASLGLRGAPVGGAGTYTYVALVLIISGLHIAASMLEKTFFEPLLRASANMFGIIYMLSFIGINMISVRNIPVGDGIYVDIDFGMGPLTVIFFAFFVAPGIALPFIEHFGSYGEWDD